MNGLFLIMLAVVPATMGYTGGAGTGACSSMRPNHGGLNPQTGISPFRVDVTQTAFSPGSEIQVTISGCGNTRFKGFLIQARRAEASADREAQLGTFNTPDGSRILSQCGADGQAITHTSAALKSSVTFTWTAPAVSPGPIVFVATFVQDISTFWVKVYSGVIREASAADANVDVGGMVYPTESVCTTTTTSTTTTTTTTPTTTTTTPTTTTTTPTTTTTTPTTTTTTPTTTTTTPTTTTTTPTTTTTTPTTTTTTPTTTTTTPTTTTATPATTTTSTTTSRLTITTPPTTTTTRMTSTTTTTKTIPTITASNSTTTGPPTTTTTRMTTTTMALPSFAYDTDCGTTKGCLTTCNGMNCSNLLAYRFLENSNEILFELTSRVDASYNQWMAIGFSDDLIMGNDSVAECVFHNGDFRVNSSYNLPKTKYNERLDNFGEIRLVSASLSDNIFRCSFVRDVYSLSGDERFFNIGKDHYLFFASGYTYSKTGKKQKHRRDPKFSHSVSLRKVEEYKWVSDVIYGGASATGIKLLHFVAALVVLLGRFV